jgi:hypothetical protein
MIVSGRPRQSAVRPPELHQHVVFEHLMKWAVYGPLGNWPDSGAMGQISCGDDGPQARQNEFLALTALPSNNRTDL